MMTMRVPHFRMPQRRLKPCSKNLVTWGQLASTLTVHDRRLPPGVFPYSKKRQSVRRGLALVACPRLCPGDGAMVRGHGNRRDAHAQRFDTLARGDLCGHGQNGGGVEARLSCPFDAGGHQHAFTMV